MAANGVMAEARMIGRRELIQRLNGIDAKLRRKIVIKALRTATKPFIKEVRSRAPVKKWTSYPSRQQKKAGTLKRSIMFKPKTYRRGETNIAIIGARYDGHRGAPHAHLPEQGTIRRYRFNPKIFGYAYGVKDVSVVSRAAIRGTSGGERTLARQSVQRRIEELRSDKGQRSTGQVSPKPFFAPTWRRNESDIIRRLGVELWRGIKGNLA